MGYYLALIELISAIAIIYLLWSTWQIYQKERLIKRAQKEPFPKEWEAWLNRTPHYRLMPKQMQKKVQARLRYFMQVKEFRPIQIVLSDEMRVIISFYAALLVLGRKDECYEILKTILIYPNVMLAPRKEINGWIVREESVILEGESSGDTVVIAWHEARRDAYHTRAHNVIIHEFAHVLDFEDGSADGTPPLIFQKRKEWQKIVLRRYEALRQKAQKNRFWGDYQFFGAYAASNEAEFFAVSTELFFQRAATFKRHFPDLYKEFYSYYNLDTAKLFSDLDHALPRLTNINR